MLSLGGHNKKICLVGPVNRNSHSKNTNDLKPSSFHSLHFGRLPLHKFNKAGETCYHKDTEPFYYYSMYAIVPLILCIYPFHAMHSLLVTIFFKDI